MKKLMRKGKSLFAMLLAVVLVASCLVYAGGTEAQAASSESDFTLESGMITAYYGTDEEVVIPSTIGGETVKGIAQTAFWEVEGLVSVDIPATVELIEQYAFCYCSDLEEVIFRGKVAKVEAEAFSDCGYFLTVKCQKQYGSYYEGLDEMTNWGYEVNACLADEGGSAEPKPEPKPEPTVTAKDIFGLEETTGGWKVTGYDVEKGGKEVTVPAEYDGKPIVEIGDEAFSLKKANVGFKNWITSITLPDTIKTIGYQAFYGCSKVAEIVLPEGLESIGKEAFRYCNNLKEINVPSTVSSIGEIAFKQSRAAYLKAINVAEGNNNFKSVDGVLLTKDGKTLLCYPTGKVGAPYEMPDTVEEIANDAFKADASTYDSSVVNGNGEHKLTEIVLSKNLKKIGERAFEQCGLTSVTITSDLEVGKYAFAGCKDLKTVVVEEGVTAIPDYTFMNMQGIESLTLPSTLKTIGAYAFDRYGAESIELPEGLETIGEDAFANSNLTSIKIPSTVNTIGPRAFYSCNDLASVEFAEGTKIESIGEFAFNWCNGLKTVTLPDSLKKLENGCFSYTGLESIQLNDGMTELGDAVFAGSKLTAIELPDSIEKMGSATFRNCGFLTYVRMPASLAELGTCTFEECVTLAKVVFSENMKLTYVPEDTFYHCAVIEYIYLPISIAETRACSFSNCDMNPVIEYANENLQRNIFDCYNIDPGEYYRLDEDGFYYTTEELPDSDYSGDIMDRVSEDDAQSSDNQVSAVYGRSAGSAMATCGCGGYAGSVKLEPTSNPTFVYKKPASSGTSAGGGTGNNTNDGQTPGTNTGNNGGQNTGNSTGNNTTNNNKNTTPKVTGTVAKTGDTSFFGGYVVLMLMAMAACVVVFAYRKRNIGQR